MSLESFTLIIMPWIEARKEWVVLHYKNWLECGASYDERWNGAWALNDYCQRKILEAYGIPGGTISLTAASTSPSDLEKMAANSPK